MCAAGDGDPAGRNVAVGVVRVGRDEDLPVAGRGRCALGDPTEPLWPPAEAPILPTSGVPIGPAARDKMQYVHEETRYQLSKFPAGYKTPGMPPRPG